MRENDPSYQSVAAEEQTVELALAGPFDFAQGRLARVPVPTDRECD
jgi:hypothetical protein